MEIPLSLPLPRLASASDVPSAFDHTVTEQRDRVKLTSRAPPPFFFSAVLATRRTYSGGVAPSAFDDSPKSGVMVRDVTSSAFFV